MNQNRNAEAVARFSIESKTHFTGGEIRAFPFEDHTLFDPSFQCQGCATYRERLRQMENLCKKLAEHIDRSEVRL